MVYVCLISTQRQRTCCCGLRHVYCSYKQPDYQAYTWGSCAVKVLHKDFTTLDPMGYAPKRLLRQSAQTAMHDSTLRTSCVQGQLVGVALSFLRNFGILSGASGVLGALSSGVASAALDDRFAV